MKANTHTLAMLLAAIVLLIYGTDVLAAPPIETTESSAVLNTVVKTFRDSAENWRDVMMSAALWLFWTLGTISLTWTMGMLALRKADIGEYFAEFIRFILFFGFFLWLLRNGPQYASDIIQSLSQLGTKAANSGEFSPSGIVDIGFLIFTRAYEAYSLMSPINSAVLIILSVVIMIILTVVAVNLVLLSVSAWFLMYAGIFFLGFGGSRWTSDMAINYYKTVLGIAVQIFAMILIISVGLDILQSFYAKLGNSTLNYSDLGTMLVASVALFMLANKIPPMLAGIITGGGAAGIGNYGANQVAGTAMAAAGMAVAAVASGGAALAAGAASGAVGGAGGISALKAAFEKAGASADGGSTMPGGIGGGPSAPWAVAQGAAASGAAEASGSQNMGAPGAQGGVASGAKAAGGPSGSNPGAPAAGASPTSGGSSSVVGLLAGGAAAVAKSKIYSMQENFMGAVGKSTGGQIAAAIRGAGASPAGAESEFGGDNLGGSRQIDPEAEIVTFNKNWKL